MSVYGRSIYTMNRQSNCTTMVEQNNYNPVAQDIATYLESVVFNEYLNYKSIIREASFHDSVLEEKAELLLEISFKDIWTGIKNLIKKLVGILKDIYTKIKEFITGKKFKMMEKKCKDLEEKIKDLEAENLKWKASSDSYKNSSKNYADELDKAKKDNDSYNNSYSDLLKDYDELENDYKDLEYSKKKELKEKDKTIDKLTSVCEKISANDYLYFNMYDYFRKDIDPARLVNSGTFSSIMQHFEYNVDSWGNDSAFILLSENLEKFCVIKSEIMNKFGEGGNGAKYGGFNHSTMHQIIREDIKNKPRFTDMKKLMDQLEWLSHGYQVSASLDIINKYQSLLGKVEGYLKKYYPEEKKKLGEDNSLPLIVQSIKGYMGLIDSNVRLISVMSNYAGRAVGAASSAILALSAVTGVELE